MKFFKEIQQPVNEISRGDYYKKATMQRGQAGMSAAFAASPEEREKHKAIFQKRERGLNRLKARQDKERKAEQDKQLADLVARLPELKAEYESMKEKYKSLGGSNWQYADREQNLTDSEREARAMEGPMNTLWRQIQAAEKAQGQQGVSEGWKDEAQELEDWAKEVNTRLYKAHESQRLGLARQLSKLEQKHFGSEFTHPNLTEIVWSALRALQKGDMVHYDPERVGQMPFGSAVGDDAKLIAQYNITRDELAGYRMLHDKGMVDNLEQFLKLRRLVRAKSWSIAYLEELEQLAPEEAWLKMANDLNWSKDGMNEEVQAKTDDKLLAYYAQRKAEAEKKKKEQGVTEGQPSMYYSEELAQKVFDQNPNLDASGKADAVLDAGWPIAVADLGKKSAQHKFAYDEDFPSDFVSMYAQLQKQQQGVTEGSDIDARIANLKDAIRFETPRSIPGEHPEDQYIRHAEKIAGYKAELKKLVAQKKQQGVTEGVAETLPLNDALKLLRQYGAEHFKTTTNELHFYKNGQPFSVDLVLNPDTTRSVTLSSLNAARRGLTGQGVAEGTLSESDSPVASAITRRILLQRHDLLSKYGPVKVMAAIDDVADFVGDTEEIGSSDVSAWIQQVEQSLAGMGEGIEEDTISQMRDYFSRNDDSVDISREYSDPVRKEPPVGIPPEIQALVNKMYHNGKITQQEFQILKNFQKKTKINVGVKEADMSTGNQGYDSMLAVMKAVDAGHDATFNLGGEPITLDYNEARFLAGRYKAFLKAGRQEEFLKYMESPVAFDRLMKQLRDLMDKQRNFRGSVPGERGVEEGVVDTIKAGAKKAFDVLTGGDDEQLLQRLEKETGGKRPEKKETPPVKENEYYCRLDNVVKEIPEGYKRTADGYITRIQG